MNKVISVQLQLPEEIASKTGRMLSLGAKIVHSEPSSEHFIYGIRFESVSASDKDKLRELFAFFKQPYKYH